MGRTINRPFKTIKPKTMYTCKNSFTSLDGNFFSNKQNITVTEYERLTVDEQQNFFHNHAGTSEPNEDRDELDDVVDTAFNIGIGMALGSMFDSDNSSSSDSSSSDSFDGFGGGDFGGGGASSDY